MGATMMLMDHLTDPPYGLTDPIRDFDYVDSPAPYGQSPAPNSFIDTSGLDDEDDEEAYCYACLEFPDAIYYVKERSVVIGRNTHAISYYEQQRDSRSVEQPRVVEDEEDQSEDGEEDVVDEEAAGRSPSSADEEHHPYLQYPDGPIFDKMSKTGGIVAPQTQHSDVWSNPHDLETESYIAVHPPADVGDGKLYGIKGISKKHIRIQYTQEHGWTVEVLGRNGIFVNSEFYERGAQLILEDKDEIVIQGLPMIFHLSDVSDGEVGDWADEPSDRPANHLLLDRERAIFANERDSADELDDEDDDEDADPDRAMESTEEKVNPPKLKLKFNGSTKTKILARAEKKANKSVPRKEQKTRAETNEDSASPSEDTPVRRRGPGRPPADGVMSKRERKEREKAARAGVEYGDPLPAKMPKALPRSDSKAEGDEAESKDSIPKTKKRKREDGEDGKTDHEAKDDSKPDSEPPTTPRSPSPKESDYPPEALVKPDRTYHSLLHEILFESKEALALPQIYKAIRRKWPYYQFKIGGSGWESSVRHNLGNNNHFMTAGKAGKGYYWTINPAVPFEPKQKRANDTGHLPYYTTGPAAPLPNVRPAAHPGVHSNVPQYPNSNVGQYPSRPPVQYNVAPPTANQIPRPPVQSALANYPQPYPQQYPQAQPLVNGYRPLPHPPQTGPARPSSTIQPSAPTPASSTYTTKPATSLPPPHMNATTPIPRAPYPNPTISQTASRPVVQAVPSPNGTHALSSRPQSTQPPRVNSPASTNSTDTAFDQVRRGKVPDLFRRFKEQLARTARNGDDAKSLQDLADRSIDWILANPSAEQGTPDLPLLMVELIQILRRMMHDELSTRRRTPGNASVVTVNGHAQTPPLQTSVPANTDSTTVTSAHPANQVVQTPKQSEASVGTATVEPTESDDAAKNNGISPTNAARSSPQPASATAPAPVLVQEKVN